MLNRCRNPLRAALVLRFYLDVSGAEAAASIGSREGSVRSELEHAATAPAPDVRTSPALLDS